MFHPLPHPSTPQLPPRESGLGCLAERQLPWPPGSVGAWSLTSAAITTSHILVTTEKTLCEGSFWGFPGGLPGRITMVSPSVSPVRLTSSPLEAARSPSPPKIILGKRSAAAFLKPSVELKHKPLLISSPGLSPSLVGLNLASPGLSPSIGISSPSPRILLRPEVAAYLARGRFIVFPV